MQYKNDALIYWGYFLHFFKQLCACKKIKRDLFNVQSITSVGRVLREKRIGKSTPKVPQLGNGIKNVLNRKTKYAGSLNYIKPVIRGPSAVFIPILVYLAAESA